jgi:hypothetical protein
MLSPCTGTYKREVVAAARLMMHVPVYSTIKKVNRVPVIVHITVLSTELWVSVFY